MHVPTLYNHLSDYINTLTGMPVYLPHYRLSPEHRFPSQIEDTLTAFETVQKEGYSPENIIFMGDSAGGNLVISSMLKLLEDKKKLPGAGVCLSAWLNLSEPEQRGTYLYNDETDFIRVPQILNAVGAYVDDLDQVNNPLISPVCSDRLAELPPLFFAAGGGEVLLDHTLDFVSTATDQGHNNLTVKLIPFECHNSFILSLWGQESATDIMKDFAGWLATVYPSPHHGCSSSHPIKKFLAKSFTQHNRVCPDMLNLSEQHSDTTLTEYMKLYNLKPSDFKKAMEETRTTTTQ